MSPARKQPKAEAKNAQPRKAKSEVVYGPKTPAEVIVQSAGKIPPFEPDQEATKEERELERSERLKDAFHTEFLKWMPRGVALAAVVAGLLFVWRMACFVAPITDQSRIERFDLFVKAASGWIVTSVGGYIYGGHKQKLKHRRNASTDEN